MIMNISKKIFAVAICWMLFQLPAFAQAALYPTHWWTGMKYNKIQVLIHDAGIGKQTLRMKPYAGVTLKKITKAESENYVFADIEISAAAKPGTLHFTAGTADFPFQLKQRRAGRGTQFAQGVTSKDFIYLIMPDRFSDGDANNNIIPGYKDMVVDRKNPSAHHGGDIQGVINHLDYMKDLGITSVWMCPVTENDMPWKEEPGGAISGYHGYWITNHYKIDKRYGAEAAYKKMSDELHTKGMKLVQDAVYNHVGDEHFLYKDMPFKDMFNYWPAYTGSNHREEALYDAHRSKNDEKVMLDGWFTPHLPDVNLRNPYMAKFMIQNHIWCTEEFGVDGWRVDTYKYCYEPFLNDINDALLKEYPNLTVFGEAWCNSVVGSAYFTRNNMQLPFKHNLQGVTDFPMQGAMLASVNQGSGWTDGTGKLYSTLAQDMLYKDPNYNCIFLDNHDMDRYTTMIGGDMQKFKMGFALLLTQRGIPQMYYGTEIAMKNDTVNGDGKKRNDFPGGFAQDPGNKFEAVYRTTEENDAFEYVKALANFRRTSSAISTGKLMQYVPKNGVYVYFRYDANQTVMVAVNTNDKPSEIATATYKDRIGSFTRGMVIGRSETVFLNSTLSIPAKTALVMELK
jgi:glycosidase